MKRSKSGKTIELRSEPYTIRFRVSSGWDEAAVERWIESGMHSYVAINGIGVRRPKGVRYELLKQGPITNTRRAR